MAPKDRTAEFHSALNSIKSRTVLPSSAAKGKDAEAKQRLLGDSSNGGPSGSHGAPAGQQGKKSEFGRMAGAIAKDINSTTMKLQKLAQREW